MSFAQSAGTPSEVRAETTRLNDRDLDAQWRHLARQHFGKTFDAPFRGRIGPPPRRTNPSSHRGKLNEMASFPLAKIRESCLRHDDCAEEIRLDLCAEI